MICSPESIIDDCAVTKFRNKTIYCISYFSSDYSGGPGIRTYVEIYLGSWFEANFTVAEKACMLGQLWCGHSRLFPGVLADQGGRKGKEYGEQRAAEAQPLVLGSPGPTSYQLPPAWPYLLKVPGPLKTAPPPGD